MNVHKDTILNTVHDQDKVKHQCIWDKFNSTWYNIEQTVKSVISPVETLVVLVSQQSFLPKKISI